MPLQAQRQSHYEKKKWRLLFRCSCLTYTTFARLLLCSTKKNMKNVFLCGFQYSEFTCITPGFVISLLVCSAVSEGGVRGLEDVFLTPTRSWAWPPAYPAWLDPPPPSASLPSELESLENWKEKIFALKILHKLSKFEKGTISSKIFKFNFFEAEI